MKKICALALVLCCLAGLVSSAGAEALLQAFYAPVMTLEGNTITGNFVREGDRVFIELETLARVDPTLEAYFTESGDAIWLTRQSTVETTIEIESTRFTDIGIAVPFFAATQALGIEAIAVQSEYELEPRPEMGPAAEKYRHGRLIMAEIGNPKRLSSVVEALTYEAGCEIVRDPNHETAVEWLLEVQESQASTGAASSGAAAPADGPIYISITWDSMANGQPMDIAASITGMLDDGTDVFLAPDAEEVSDSNGLIALQRDYGDSIELMVCRHDSVLDVTVEYGDVMPFGAPSYADANVEIQIYDEEENIIAVIAANPDASAYSGSPYVLDQNQFYARGGAGVWYYAFRMDHGVVKSVW